MPTAPVLRENRVLVPMRAYLESLGAEVLWAPPDTATARLSGRTVEMKIGSTVALVDGKAFTLDVPAQLIENRTYLPLRFLSEGLGAQVGYDGASVTVNTGTAAARLRVVDGPLNVRQSPTTGASILTTVPTGTTLSVLKQEAAWTQVQLPKGKVGWVSNQFTRLISAQPTVDSLKPLMAQAEGFLQVGQSCVGAVPMINERLYLPLKASVEQLGGTVSSEGSGFSVRLQGRRLTVTPGQTSAILDGSPYTLSAAPILAGGQVLIAIRALTEALQIPMGWNEATRTASLGSITPGTACNPSIAANSYLIMDAATGAVLSESRSRTPYQVASTTKIMTALLAVEQGNPDWTVTVSRNASNQPGTSVLLRLGERRSLRELLYGLMLVSGNDAATAIAEHLSGTEAGFARVMTQRAAELGATSTLFYNASGLDDYNDPYSTARDMALISRHAMQNADFRLYMGQRQIQIPGPAGTRTLTNRNDFVLTYPGATGVKNGWTEKANHTLVASAFRGNRELIVVLLGAPSRTSLYQQATLLMDHGFRVAEQSWLLKADR